MSIIVIDVGSSSVRATLFDDDANIIPHATAQRQHQPDVHGAFDIARLQARIEDCIDEIVQHPQASDVSAVGMDTLVGNIVGIAADGTPLTPLLTYAETRNRDELEALRPFYEVSDTHQRTGCPHYTAYLPSLLQWFRHAEPATFQQVAQWVDLGSFLYRDWLGGDVPISYSCASWTGLLNRASLSWDSIWLQALDMSPNDFAPLADFDAIQQGLKPLYADRWQQLANVPFYLAIGDGAAANIGSGAIDDNAIALTIGTTAALRMVTTADNPPVPDGLWSYRVDAKRHLIGGATTEGGNVYRWIADNFQLPDDAEAQIATRSWGDHGLDFIPLLGGERTPGYNPSVRGEIRGLRFDTTPTDILQAGLEGVTQRLKYIYDRLPKRPNSRIYAGGGALLGSSIWVDMIAQHFDAEIELIHDEAVTAGGVAQLIVNQRTDDE